jgi:N-acyl homoserine lactone hydrolase
MKHGTAGTPRHGGPAIGFRILPVLAALCLAASVAAPQSKSPKPPKSVRLYVFDNGVIKGLDTSFFHLTLPNGDMVVSSYLIVHPKGTLIWDTGAIPDTQFPSDGGPAIVRFFRAGKTLRSQLAAIGYAPERITYLGLSHYHSDHTANAGEFAGATWIVQQPERDAMFAEKPPPITAPAHYAALKNRNTKILNGEDYDVFGDGKVVIKAAYGHTPGHQVLYVNLAKTGPVLLAGDLYHFQQERGTDKVPTFEFNRDQSLASRSVIEAFLKKTKAQLWIEHDLAHFNELKKSPAYYE